MSISPISPLASGTWNKVLDATGPDSSAAASKVKPAVSAASAKDVKHAASQFEAMPHLKKAVIAHRGALAPDYRYLQEYLDRSRR